MADEATPIAAAISASAETRSEVTESVAPSEKVGTPAESTPAVSGDGAPATTTPVAQEETAASAPSEVKLVAVKADPEANANDKPTSEPVREDISATIQDKMEDEEVNGAVKPEKPIAAAAPGNAAAPTEGSAKPKTPSRRKSGGVPEHQRKKANKKGAKESHPDAQPGDHYMLRLKGYPLWPGIICDETMLPSTLLKNRPVTAMRADGTYREDYADGGPRMKSRTFPAMYLHTNEFSWVASTDLVDVNWDTIGQVTTSMRKDLAAAHLLAAEEHTLEYYKEILVTFMEQRAADEEAIEAALAAKVAAKAEKAANKGKNKRKSLATIDDDDDADGDIDMADAPADPDTEPEVASEKKKSKKRKASDDVEGTPKNDSVKKPKTTINIKINTPKATNGASTPKSSKDSAAKSAKPKVKKSAPKGAEAPEVVAAPKEPELSPEEKRAKKEKEILFLRHRLQKGLLTKDQAPKEEEMPHMSEFVSKLEGYADLEVSIMRATKINKVLKAILKLNNIPNEDKFHFKPRAQTLLDKWNKLLATEGTPAASVPPTATNGVKEEKKADDEDAKATPIATSNGTKESSAEVKVDEKVPDVEEAVSAPKDDALKVDEASTPSIEEPAPTTKADEPPVETAA